MTTGKPTTPSNDPGGADRRDGLRFLWIPLVTYALATAIDHAFILLSPHLRFTEDHAIMAAGDFAWFGALNALLAALAFGRHRKRLAREDGGPASLDRSIGRLKAEFLSGVAALAAVYVAWAFAATMQDLARFGDELTPLRAAAILWSLAYSFAAVPLYVDALLFRGWSMRVRKAAFERTGSVASPAGGAFALELLAAFAVTSLLPISILALDFAAFGSSRPESAFVYLAVDVASVLIAAPIAIAATAKTTTGPIAELSRSFARVRGGDLTARTPVLADHEIGSLAADFNAMVAGLEESERAKRLFGRYVSAEVAGELLARRGERFVERREITALFTDIEGFTSLAEGADPEALADALNSYYRAVADAIAKHGGTVNKFLGDGVLAFFNAPIDDPAHAKRAVMAALEVLSASRRAFGPAYSFKTRIGVNTGVAIVGCFGSDDRLEYTALGDAINTAQRLEAANKGLGTSLLFGPRTAELAGIQEARVAGNVELKGKKEAIAAWTIADL